MKRTQDEVIVDSFRGSLTRAQLERAEAARERDQLRAFACAVMEAWPEGAMDGGALQDAAITYGLIREKAPAPTKPCGEGCVCAEYYGDMSDGVECYERTELLSPNA